MFTGIIVRYKSVILFASDQARASTAGPKKRDHFVVLSQPLSTNRWFEFYLVTAVKHYLTATRPDTLSTLAHSFCGPRTGREPGSHNS